MPTSSFRDIVGRYRWAGTGSPLLAPEDGNSRAPNKSWYRDVVGNQAEESGVRLRGWARSSIWFTTE